MPITDSYNDLSFFTSTRGKSREPKLQNRWLLRLDRIPIIPTEAINANAYGASDDEFATLLLSLNNFSRPEYSVDPFEIPNFNDMVYFAGKPSHSREISCEFIDLIGNEENDSGVNSTAEILYKWYSLIYNPDFGTVGYKDYYTVEARLYLFGPNGQQIEQWHYYNMWPFTLSFGEVTHEGAEKLLISVTFKYDRARMISQEKVSSDIIPENGRSPNKYKRTLVTDAVDEEATDSLGKAGQLHTEPTGEYESDYGTQVNKYKGKSLTSLTGYNIENRSGQLHNEETGKYETDYGAQLDKYKDRSLETKTEFSGQEKSTGSSLETVQSVSGEENTVGEDLAEDANSSGQESPTTGNTQEEIDELSGEDLPVTGNIQPTANIFSGQVPPYTGSTQAETNDDSGQEPPVSGDVQPNDFKLSGQEPPVSGEAQPSNAIPSGDEGEDVPLGPSTDGSGNEGVSGNTQSLDVNKSGE